MKQLYSLIVLIIVLSGCKDKARFTVNGFIKENKKEYIYINRLDVDTPVLIDSAKINKKGRFSFKIASEETDFYQLGFSNTDFMTILAQPGEHINLIFNGKNLYHDYTVSGSDGTEKLRVLDYDLEITKRKLDSLSALYAKESSLSGFDKRGPELEQQFSKVLKEQRQKNISFIISNYKSLACIKALFQKVNSDVYVLYDQKDLQYMKIAKDSLSKYFPDSKHVQALAANFTKEMNQMYSAKLQMMTRDLPETKLDPNLKNTEGQRIALSSLKGKIVLLTFWSVKSNDCIEENLQLKEWYKLYRNKGFEIYQINLDENEAAWRAAVKFDELPWISTREDDQKMLNAMLYNVKAVPANFLYDRKGNIIALNLHGNSLKIKLQQLFN